MLYTEHRYGWSPMWNGVSLAVVGVCAAVVQGWLTGKVTARLGDWRTAFLGLTITMAAYLLYGLASHGWMIYVIIAFGSLGGMAGPAVQGLISNSVGNDEQGTIQGAITSLESVSGIIGPLIATDLFGYFIAPEREFPVPGAPFFSAALIAAGSLLLAWRAKAARDRAALRD